MARVTKKYVGLRSWLGDLWVALRCERGCPASSVPASSLQPHPHQESPGPRSSAGAHSQGWLLPVQTTC